VKYEDDWVEQSGWMVKSLLEYLGWEYCTAGLLKLWVATYKWVPEPFV